MLKIKRAGFDMSGLVIITENPKCECEKGERLRYVGTKNGEAIMKCRNCGRETILSVVSKTKK